MRHTHLGVYGFINKGNTCLLIKKARGPYINMFDLPGGKIFAQKAAKIWLSNNEICS